MVAADALPLTERELAVELHAIAQPAAGPATHADEGADQRADGPGGDELLARYDKATFSWFHVKVSIVLFVASG